MNYNFLKEQIENGVSTRGISKLSGKSQTTVTYWLKKYNLKTNFLNFEKIGIQEYGEDRYCPRCKKNCPTGDFYNRRKKSNSSTYCKKCTNSQTLERVQQLKFKMVEYKGGCCEICGYNKYQGALEFHHLDPSKKDFNLSKLKVREFGDLVKNELGKCIMVCANCHREIHGGKIVVSPRIELGLGD